MVPHDVMDGSAICSSGITSSLVFEILWFLIVDRMCLRSVIVFFPRHWYLRFCGSSW